MLIPGLLEAAPCKSLKFHSAEPVRFSCLCVFIKYVFLCAVCTPMFIHPVDLHLWGWVILNFLKPMRCLSRGRSVAPKSGQRRRRRIGDVGSSL